MSYSEKHTQLYAIPQQSMLPPYKTAQGKIHTQSGLQKTKGFVLPTGDIDSAVFPKIALQHHLFL